MKKFLIAIIFIIGSGISIGQPDVYDKMPQRIVLNLTENPSSEIAVTWRTNLSFPNSEIQYAETASWITFKKEALKVTPKEETLLLESGREAFYYSAVLTGLKPNTKYLYRVGHDSLWSEWNQFETAKNEAAPLKFVFMGDPQNDIKEHCSRIFREAFKFAPDANFWLFSGDIATDPYDNLWNELFDAAGFIFRITPSILTPGNHDHKVAMVDGKKTRLRTISETWLAHFTHPENGPADFKETTYYLDYQGVRFIMINSYNKVAEQAVWLENVLKSNTNKWTVLSFHIPIFSMAKDRDSKVTRDAFMPLIDKYGVDLVLTGHDHTYGRSKKLYNAKPVDENSKGTYYVLTVSGPKMYPLNSQYDDIMVKTGSNIQLFQIIEINDNRLMYKSYTADGILFDEFEVRK